MWKRNEFNSFGKLFNNEIFFLILYILQNVFNQFKYV